MRILRWALAFASILHIPLCAAKSNCPLYGPLLPRPKNLLQDSGIQYAASLLDELFPKYIDNDNSSGSQRFSYSVEVFSGTEDRPLWSHYWTAPNLGTFSNSPGVKKVDGDTVYRVGSITKVFTMLTFLATVGDGIMNDPITKYLPEIAELARRNDSTEDPIFTPDWDSITVGSLATQTSGLIRDYSLLGELAYQLPLDSLYKMGFPPIPLDNFPPCGTSPTCNRTQLFAGLGRVPPSFAPFTTPAYSDLGFTLLSYIAERITGKGYKSLLQETVLDPLNLKHTFYRTPDDSVGVIPGSRNSTSWAADLGEEAATGNMYTSSNDLSNFGRAILRSTLLKPAMTRRWMKPFSFTSDPKAMVGMPWGVRKIDLATNNSHYEFVHTYNKAGSIGSYLSLFALIPELEIGYAILAAGQPPATLTLDIAEALTKVYIPTLKNAAEAQANATYGGHYRYTGNLTSSSNTNITNNYRYNNKRFANATAPLNSSLVIAADDRPGLGVSRWFSNGTDMSYIAVAIGANISSDYFDKMQPSVRLYPTGLEQATPSGGKRVAFKAVFEDLSAPDKNGTYASDCASWVTVTAAVYGSRPLDMFIFDVDRTGVVRGVENGALRLRMDKVA